MQNIICLLQTRLNKLVFMKIFRVSFSERVNIIKRIYSSIRKFKSNKLKTLDKLYFKQDVLCQQNISFSCLYTPKKHPFENNNFFEKNVENS